MPRQFQLTPPELQLIAATLKTPAFPGLEELALTAESKIGLSARDNLVRKGLLKAGEDGRFSLDRTTGYIFSGILKEKEYLRGDVLTPGGGARVNLYFVDDAFLLALWNGAGSISCVWLPTIQLAMGALLHYADAPEELAASGRLEDSGLQEALDRAEKPKAAFSYALGERRFRCVVGEAGLNVIEENGLKPATVAEFFAPLSRETLRVHQRKIAEVANG